MAELRIAGATTIEDANVGLKDFLIRFNERFGVAAQHPEVAYRPLEPDMCLDGVLCFKHGRKVARDNTVQVPLANIAVAAWQRTAELRRNGGRGAGRSGRPAGCAVPQRDHTQPGGANPPGPAAKLQWLFLIQGTPTSWSQRSGQALGGDPGSD